MPRWQRIYLSACAGVAAYALTYVVVDYARVPRLMYFPRERRFELLARAVDPAASGYVGLWLWAMAAGALVSLATALVLRRGRRAASAKALGLGAAWTATALAIGLAYFAWNNWP